MALWGKTDATASKPKYLNADAMPSADSDNAYFVDLTEAGVAANRAKGIVTPGWNLVQDIGNGRTRVETLVAMKVSAADAGDTIGDDAIIADFTINITTQPVDTEAAGGANAVLSVVAATVPTGGTLAYQWQLSDDNGATWADITGETADEITITSVDPEYVDGNQFRVIVSGSGASVTSDAAVLTVTA